MKAKNMRDVARAALPAGVWEANAEADTEAEHTPMAMPAELDEADIDALFDAEPNCDDEEFHPQWEPLARHLGGILRQQEGIELHALGDIFGHEWGWSIELTFHAIPYSLIICETAPLSGDWQLLLRCHAGCFDRWFNRRLIRFCDEQLCQLTESAMREHPAINDWQWVYYS